MEIRIDRRKGTHKIIVFIDKYAYIKKVIENSFRLQGNYYICLLLTYVRYELSSVGSSLSSVTSRLLLQT